jgi:peptide chain release factor 1
MFEAAEHLRAEFAKLESALADPEVHTDLARARRIGRRYAELTPIVRALDEYTRLTGDLAAAQELGSEDELFAAEAVDQNS